MRNRTLFVYIYCGPRVQNNLLLLKTKTFFETNYFLQNRIYFFAISIFLFCLVLRILFWKKNFVFTQIPRSTSRAWGEFEMALYFSLSVVLWLRLESNYKNVGYKRYGCLNFGTRTSHRNDLFSLLIKFCQVIKFCIY